MGAGAWGLPAAAELAARGHEVTLLDRHGVGNPLASSSGPTRLWRLTHPDAVRVRLAQRAVAAWDRLARLSGRELTLRRGLLWRDDDTELERVGAALRSAGVGHTEVAAGEVGRFFLGLRPDGRAAVWQDTAGPVLAAQALRAQADRYARAGGVLVVGELAQAVELGGERARVRCAGGSAYDADVVILAPGPGAQPLLAGLGVELALSPRLEQVVHFGDPADPGATDRLPCLFDGPGPDEPALYAMPTPGVGYKVGLEAPLRELAEGDDDRTPDGGLVRRAAERVRRDLTAVTAHPLDAQVCCWTDSPDGRFVIDSLAGGTVVIACGCSGEGFKFSALVGLLLADLAEGQEADPDLATFGLARFSGGAPPPGGHRLGR